MTTNKDQEPLSLKDLVITSVTETFDDDDKKGVKDGLPRSVPSTVPSSPALPVPSSIPVTLTRSFQITLSEGDAVISTDCFVQLFSDRVFMGISQMKGRIGNYLLCQAEPSQVKPKTFEYEISNLLGAREDPLLSVFARRIAEVLVQFLPPMESLTLILGISLQNNEMGRDPEVFRSTVDIMIKLYVEAMNR
eukprot:CAMPEP_0198149976 /NCGR_PEP_ID=MMETSP1443-20131203/48857_1 /TAXON_ID=186043 /ORGANISM="Entomoneis sp., Strain CCMP2396" /LENGTH=191 /DNA_ID=CAMNT_0043815153 /DNA_START=28 /DNA_END=603 /DNA_ORIENTATION=+